MKRCSKCLQEKPFIEFKKNKSRKNGVASICLVCDAKDRSKWQKNNSEKVYQKNVKWRAENAEKVRAFSRKWRIENIEKARELVRVAGRIWKKNHPEKVQQYNRNRKAFIRGAGGKITSQEWEWLKDFYNHTCLCCGKKEPEIVLTLDHVVPLKLGGKNTIQNSQPLCHVCNSSKKATFVDYRKELSF